MLLHGRSGGRRRLLFDVGSDDDRLDLVETMNTVLFAPIEKLPDGAGVRGSRVPVPNRCGEKLDEAPGRGFAGTFDDSRKIFETRSREISGSDWNDVGAHGCKKYTLQREVSGHETSLTIPVLRRRYRGPLRKRNITYAKRPGGRSAKAGIGPVAGSSYWRGPVPRGSAVPNSMQSSTPNNLQSDSGKLFETAPLSTYHKGRYDTSIHQQGTRPKSFKVGS